MCPNPRRGSSHASLLHDLVSHLCLTIGIVRVTFYWSGGDISYIPKVLSPLCHPGALGGTFQSFTCRYNGVRRCSLLAHRACDRSNSRVGSQDILSLLCRYNMRRLLLEFKMADAQVLKTAMCARSPKQWPLLLLPASRPQRRTLRPFGSGPRSIFSALAGSCCLRIHWRLPS